MSHPLEYDPLEDGLFLDMAAILSQDLSDELPTVAPVLGGRCLLYAGRINEIHAEPGVGKTNIVLALAKAVLDEGKTVAYIDPEDNPRAAVRRLLRFGCTPEQIVRHFKYAPSPAPGSWPQLLLWARAHQPDLIAFDGMAELLAAFGINENDPAEFLNFCRGHLSPLAQLGLCVLLSDHMAKAVEGRGDWSRGTSAKLGKYDGSCFLVELGQGYSPTQAGYVKLRITKDRNGGVGLKQQHFADLHFTPNPSRGGTDVEFRAISPAPPKDPLAPIKEKITRHLQTHPEASLRELIRLGGKAGNIQLAIDALQASGRLHVETSGPGKPNRYRLLDAPSAEPLDQPEPPTAPLLPALAIPPAGAGPAPDAAPGQILGYEPDDDELAYLREAHRLPCGMEFSTS